MVMEPGELSHNVTCVMLTYQLVTDATCLVVWGGLQCYT